MATLMLIFVISPVADVKTHALVFLQFIPCHAIAVAGNYYEAHPNVSTSSMSLLRHLCGRVRGRVHLRRRRRARLHSGKGACIPLPLPHAPRLCLVHHAAADDVLPPRCASNVGQARARDAHRRLRRHRGGNSPPGAKPGSHQYSCQHGSSNNQRSCWRWTARHECTANL